VHEDHVGDPALEHLDRLGAGRGDADDVHPEVLQRHPDRLREEHVVVDDQDTYRRRHLPSLGNVRQNVTPSSSESAQIRPPCACTTRAAIYRPSPVPLAPSAAALPRTNGPNMSWRSTCGIPRPSFLTRNSTASSTASIATVTFVPGSA